jgi:hypothetical protein
LRAETHEFTISERQLPQRGMAMVGSMHGQSRHSRFRRALCLIPVAAVWACAKPPPPIEDVLALSPATVEVSSGRLLISSRASDAPAVVPVESRFFDSWSELVAFAERELGAEPVYGPGGDTVAVQGELVQSGEIILRDANGTVFADEEFVPAYLGGATGRLRVGAEQFDLQSVAPDSSVVLFAQSAENCVGSDCIAGESWLTHRVVYHSVGGKTRQTSGGTRTVSYQCCTNGRLVTVDGRRQCRRLRPGAWEYDPELGILVPIPTGEDPYVYSEPQICSRSTLANQLRVDLRLIFGPNQFGELSAEQENTKEVQIKKWLITLGIDAGTDFVDDVIGVCGFHSSNRGGSTRTSDGFTGDDDLLCQQGVVIGEADTAQLLPAAYVTTQDH